MAGNLPLVILLPGTAPAAAFAGDPAVAPDGTLWVTFFGDRRLARIDGMCALPAGRLGVVQ